MPPPLSRPPRSNATWSRRFRSALAAQLALMVALASSASGSPPDGHRVILGAEMSAFGGEAGSFTDPGSRRLFRRHFDSLSPGNELKWEFVEPEPGSFDFSHADPMLDFADRHSADFRGHALVWHLQMPRWLWSRDPALAQYGVNETGKASWTPQALTRIMRRHIRGVVGHYRGRIRTWDVVNEAVEADGALRDNWLFPQVIGPTYIAKAFRYAHRADPAAKLAYNDFGIEVQNPKSDGVYRLLRDLIDRGVPVDQLGIQGHMDINAPVPAVADLVANMRRFADLGLELEITELDVALPNGAPVTPELLARQAAFYGALAEACQQVEACRKVTVWGVSDNHSWLAGTSPLPFDRAYQPKPAWDALMAALR
jgi:endo-1,4-beta-xylanase